MKYMRTVETTNQNYEINKKQKAPSYVNQFFPFDISEITSSEAEEVETYYANRYKWS